jgi:hypothetical protein
MVARRGEVERARQELERARGLCGKRQQGLVISLEKEIDQQEGALRSREEEQRARGLTTEREAPALPEFLDWVRSRREAADKSETDVSCPARGERGHGWCTTSREANSTVFRTRYLQADHSVFRFEVTLKGVITCEDLGEHRQLRTWQTKLATLDGGLAERMHCELTNTGLRGLAALVTAGPQHSELYVFSPSYVARDDEFRRVIQREGR